jgi:hypothetical protein
LGGDFHLGSFENDDRKYSVSTLGAQFHMGYNINKHFSVQLGVQKYALYAINLPEKSYSDVRYSYLDVSLNFIYRFIKRGSRFIPYLQAGFIGNSTLLRTYTGLNSPLEETGFLYQGSYANIGGGTLFVLANQFTIFAETNLAMHPKSVFLGTYTSDIFKIKPGISVGVNYHF